MSVKVCIVGARSATRSRPHERILFPVTDACSKCARCNWAALYYHMSKNSPLPCCPGEHDFVWAHKCVEQESAYTPLHGNWASGSCHLYLFLVRRTSHNRSISILLSRFLSKPTVEPNVLQGRTHEVQVAKHGTKNQKIIIRTCAFRL